MERSNCVGCKTHFEQGDKLPAQGITIELKNYPFPIKQNKHRWNLLKTICSFLNSKGGTIFVGAEDTTGEVKGIKMQRKEMDDFRIFIQQITMRIVPKLDLSDREDVIVHFVPIVSKGKFTGKYLIKIIVKQGITTEMYCFSQKIQFQQANSKKSEQFEVYYAYRRTNAANIQQFKQYKLIQEIKNRLTKPPQICNCFHENCNPQPVSMSVQILKIGFSNITLRHTRQIIQQWSQSQLNKLGFVDWMTSYDAQNKMVVVQLQKKSQFTLCQQFIDKNLSQLNNTLEFYCKFVKRDIFLDCLVYENVIKEPVLQQEEKKQKKKFIKKIRKVQQSPKKQDGQQWVDQTLDEQVSEKKQKPKKQQQQINFADSKQTPKKNKQAPKQQISQKQTPKKVNPIDLIGQNNKIQNGKKQAQKSNQQKKEKVITNIQKMFNTNANNTGIGKKFGYTFTHINPKKKVELRQNIENRIKYKKIFEVYENSLEVFFQSDEKLDQFSQFAENNKEILNKQYGFKQQIKMGYNTGFIQILNYDKSKGKQFELYLRDLFGKDLKGIETFARGKKKELYVQLTKPTVCAWLDRLLTNPDIKNFKIQGGGNVPKMKFILVCLDPFDEEPYQMMM